MINLTQVAHLVKISNSSWSGNASLLWPTTCKTTMTDYDILGGMKHWKFFMSDDFTDPLRVSMNVLRNLQENALYVFDISHATFVR
jgi:hypothetical protein